MTFHVSDKVHRLWDEWNLRGAILFSLFLQVLMTLSAPSRKRMKNKMLTSVLWSAYLLADWVAAFAIGLIVSVQGDNCDKAVVNKDLAAFWSPFLLLHLGGPDTITAFSPEDNELWLRHLAGLLFQLGAVVYVFSQSAHSEFWIPTVLLIFAGTIKYGERTRALYLARSGNYNKSYRGFVSEIKKEAENMSDIEVVEAGKTWFKDFRLLILHSMSNELNTTAAKSFFSHCSSKDAYRIMEAELNFMYDTLYTKMVAVHNKTGYIFRFICYLLIVISFQQFASHHNKKKFHAVDIVITYTLLICAIGLDLVSVLILIFSDWTIASIKDDKAKSIISVIPKSLPIWDKRWRQSASQFSFISYCSLFKRSYRLDQLIDFLGLKEILDEMRYTKTNLVKDSLIDFIFEGLKSMSLKVRYNAFYSEVKKKNTVSLADYDSFKDIFLARGNWILSENFVHLINHPSIIRWSVSKQVHYYESLLMWHIATEVCYITDPGDPLDCNREYSKMLSDYMLYLLVMQPATLVESATGIIAQRIFQATYVHVEVLMQPLPNDNSIAKFNTVEEFVCDCILQNSLNQIRFTEESVLKEAGDLALSLLKIEDKKKRWEMMGKVWEELLRFGAMNSTASSHAQLLSKGGELITLVSLLNAHFGLGYQFAELKPFDRLTETLASGINEDANALDLSQSNIV